MVPYYRPHFQDIKFASKSPVKMIHLFVKLLLTINIGYFLPDHKMVCKGIQELNPTYFHLWIAVLLRRFLSYKIGKIHAYFALGMGPIFCPKNGLGKALYISLDRHLYSNFILRLWRWWAWSQQALELMEAAKANCSVYPTPLPWLSKICT